jgi:hypothetical protein
MVLQDGRSETGPFRMSSSTKGGEMPRHMAFLIAHTFLHGDWHCLHGGDGGIGGAPRGDDKMGGSEQDWEPQVKFHEAHIGKRKADAPKVRGEPHSVPGGVVGVWLGVASSFVA